MTDIVVVGAGQAGASLVAELRKQGFDGRLTLIGAEPVPPYQRPPLSKGYLTGDLDRERLFLRPERFYEENDIALHLGAPVDRIDRAGKTLRVAGRDVPYDRLALVTGSVPRRLPADIGGNLTGVFVLRSLADVDAMAGAFKPGARALVVGGGYIGLEAAAVARKLGVEVTLVEAAERILQRVAAPETAAFFRDLHKRHGVDLREGVGVRRLTGDGRVTGADLSDGSHLTVDFVIVGIGILPETGLARAAGLEIDNGIAVDAQGRTSDPAIWAAGDCCSFPLDGGRIRLESVPHAIEQAECVARNMLGANEAYVPRPWFWSDQYDVKLQIAGLCAGYDRAVTRPGTGESLSVWYFAGQRLLAVDAMNAPRAYMVGKRLIEGGHAPPPEAVADPDTDLKALLAR